MKTFNIFTKQYQLSKTLRFELKPVGKTLNWIKKNKIITYENGEIAGKDAIRAANYKLLKRLMDAMHRLFINQALVILQNTSEYNEACMIIKNIEQNYISQNDLFKGDYPSVIKEKNIKITTGVKILFEQLFNRVFESWAYQYKEDMPKYWQQDIDELQAKSTLSENKKDADFYKKIIKNLENKIKKNEFKGNTYKDLFVKNVEPLQLLEWLIRSEKLTITEKELMLSDVDKNINIVHLLSIVRSFDNFASYLSGFNETRANVYNLKDFHSTSVLYRTFQQNLVFHLGNVNKWKKVVAFVSENQKALNNANFDWDQEILTLEENLNVCLAEYFVPIKFIGAFNQTGIDYYNHIIGGGSCKVGTGKAQGLNELINLARQKLGAKRHQLPTLQSLYKQILSKSDKPFIDAFKNDQELINELNEFTVQQISNEDGAINIFRSDIPAFLKEAKEAQSNIFIPKDKISVLSNLLTGSWQAINIWRDKIFDEKTLIQLEKSAFFSIEEIENWLNTSVEEESFIQHYLPIVKKYQGNKKPALAIFSQSKNLIIDAIEHHIYEILTAIVKANEQYIQLGLNKNIDKSRDDVQQNGFKQIEVIKNLLDACNDHNKFLSNFNKATKLPSNHAIFWYEELQKHIDAFPIFELYNKVRNYLTQKPFSSEKMKLNFENGTLLDGWDRNKESANYCLLFEKDDCFYLGVMTPKSNNIFDYEAASDESDNKKKIKADLKKQILTNEHDSYRKINYKLLPGANKMLPKVFFSVKNIALFQPSNEIINIKNKKLYKKEEIKKYGIENLHQYIEFCIKSLIKHPDWSREYGYSKNTFRPVKEYNSIDEFYKDVEYLGYKLTFDNIKTSYIDEKIANGELYFFQIYNKDFSKNKRGTGTDNLHTSYWKLLFSEENLQNVVLKLNGKAEIFYRQASIEYNQEKREQGHHVTYLKNKFTYPILKDRRYSVDKFLFHCPIKLNFKAPDKPYYFNEKIQKFLQHNPNVNVIGIDRGEKHLLYYSVIDQNGNILEQKSFNVINSSYKNADGIVVEKSIPYHEKLDSKEKARDKARKSWSTIENIKELKSGYLSHVVHQLAQLIIKHNAIVVLEDLNKGFKRGRFKIEKQIYQKFEKSLIDKLNYLAFKDRLDTAEAGHYLNAYQLTNKFESFEKLGKQSGIIFYVNAAYTSTTDPITGFIKNIYKRYSSVQDAMKFWKNFESIIYNYEKNRFEFTYNTEQLTPKNNTLVKSKEKLHKTKWTVCSHVTRSKYSVDKDTGIGETTTFIVTDIIKKALDKAEISYINNTDIKNAIGMCKSKVFHTSLLYCFNSILSMRVTDPSKASGTNDNDYILSPVEPFFDSRADHNTLPENGDANGAYNIARKGLLLLDTINNHDFDSNKKPDLFISNITWQNYVQKNI